MQVRSDFSSGSRRQIEGSILCRRANASDIAQVENISIWYKNVQAWDTKKDLMLLYSPTSVPMEVIADEVRNLFVSCEQQFKKENPQHWPDSESLGPFPKMHCKLDWARGGVYADKPKGSTEDTSHRKVPTFMYAGSDEDRIVMVMRECTRREMETKVFGKHAFFQMKLPSGADLKEKERFLEKVLNHGAIQKCLGQVTLKGLRRLDYKVVVELLPDGNGPRQSPGEYSLRDIAMKMRAGNSRLW